MEVKDRQPLQEKGLEKSKQKQEQKTGQEINDSKTMSAAACYALDASSKRTPHSPNSSLFEPTLPLGTTRSSARHNHNHNHNHHQSQQRVEYDVELRNSSNQTSEHRHSSTPYSQRPQQHQQQQQLNRPVGALATPLTAAIRASLIGGDHDLPEPALNELDLTPRFVACPSKKSSLTATCICDAEPHISPLDESDFVTHPAAVYEQPTLGSRLSSCQQFKPQPMFELANCHMSTFKRNGPAKCRMSKVNNHNHTRRRSSTTRADCNSLDSFQSRSSASSSVGSPPPPQAVAAAAAITSCRPLQRESSVLIGTRYVIPPSVPPSSPAPITPTGGPQTNDEWREVPLADSHAAIEIESCNREKKKKKKSLVGSLVWTCANLRTNKSGICSGGAKACKANKPTNEAKSQVPPRPPLAPVSSDLDDSRWSQTKLGSNLGEKKEKINNNNASERRRDSSRSGAPTASSQRAGQIGKSRAPFLFAGILGSILASLFFSLGLLTIKLLPDGHGLAEKTKIVCFRGVAMMILCAITIIYQKSTFIVRRNELLVNVLRSLLGFTGIFGAYVALKYISMGDSTALVFSSPVWTSLLSHFILNEPLQWIQLVALPLSILGIVLIAHPSLLINMEHQAGFSERQPLIELVDEQQLNLPGSDSHNTTTTTTTTTTTSLGFPTFSSWQNATIPAAAAAAADAAATRLNQDLDIALNTSEHFDYEHRWKGILIALGTSIIVSFVYIVLKFRKTTPIQTTTFWLGFTTFAGALALGSLVGFGAWPASLIEWALLIFNGLCSWLGQCLLQWALKYEDASVLSVVRTLDVAMTFTLSALFLDEQILWTSILGAAIIATVVVSIMLNNYISTRLCPAGAGCDGTPLKKTTTTTTGSCRSSSVALSTGEPSGELAELHDEPIVDSKTTTTTTTTPPPNDENCPSKESRHASLAA